MIDLERGLDALDRRLKGREGEKGAAASKERRSFEQVQLEELKKRAAEEEARRGPRGRRLRVEDLPDVELLPEKAGA